MIPIDITVKMLNILGYLKEEGLAIIPLKQEVCKTKGKSNTRGKCCDN